MESIRVEVRVDRELLSEIDHARGIAPRGTWLKWAIRRVLAERSGASPVAEVSNVRALPGVGLPPVAQPEPEPAHDLPEGLRTHGGRRDVRPQS
jgi:hypothetical protein